jgi:hypothetical protein
MVRQIEMEWGDGDMIAVNGMKVRSGFVIKVRFVATDPVILASPRISLVYDFSDE